MRIGTIGLWCVGVAVLATAQERPPLVSPPRTVAHEFTSKVNGRAYRVSVSVPEKYAGNADARFPVIVVTDPSFLFDPTLQAHDRLRLSNTVPDALVVGIAAAGADDRSSRLAARQLDLTPTRVTQEEGDASTRLRRVVKTGGGADFLRVLREELIPDIERRYRTTADRTYIGWSLGGLFGAYTLLHEPGLFGRMILISPSLWWDGEIVTKYEEQYAQAHDVLPVRLFMSDGEREAGVMIESMRRFENALARRSYEGLTVTTRVFDGESHTSTIPVALTGGLQFVFTESRRAAR